MSDRTLFIQIPCYNEEATIGITIDALPDSIAGIDDIQVLIIDDGCTDDTVEVAREHGADHIIRFRKNRGLARAFEAGIQACLARGADIIVNTDADNQYCADDIPKLVEPVARSEADIVIGARPIENIDHFSTTKKLLQRLGSAVVRHVSGTNVDDAPSGFRAFSKEAAEQLHVFGDYTYTIETVIQAGQKGFQIESVPIRVNEDLRPSRLVRSIPDYIVRSVGTMARIYLIYRPLRMFIPVAVVTFLAGFGLGVRYLYFMAIGQGEGHIQSVILCALLIACSGLTALIGVVADLIATNRKLLERLDARLQKIRPTSTPSASVDEQVEPRTFSPDANLAQQASAKQSEEADDTSSPDGHPAGEVAAKQSEGA